MYISIPYHPVHEAGWVPVGTGLIKKNDLLKSKLQNRELKSIKKFKKCDCLNMSNF